MRKHMVIRTVTVTVSEIVEAEMDSQDVKDLVDTKTEIQGTEKKIKKSSLEIWKCRKKELSL